MIYSDNFYPLHIFQIKKPSANFSRSIDSPQISLLLRRIDQPLSLYKLWGLLSNFIRVEKKKKKKCPPQIDEKRWLTSLILFFWLILPISFRIVYELTFSGDNITKSIVAQTLKLVKIRKKRRGACWESINHNHNQYTVLNISAS